MGKLFGLLALPAFVMFFGVIAGIALLVVLIWLITRPVSEGSKAIGNTKKFKGSFGPFSVDLEKEPTKRGR